MCDGRLNKIITCGYGVFNENPYIREVQETINFWLYNQNLNFCLLLLSIYIILHLISLES